MKMKVKEVIKGENTWQVKLQCVGQDNPNRVCETGRYVEMGPPQYGPQHLDNLEGYTTHELVEEVLRRVM